MTGVKLKEQYISYLPLLQTLNNISVIMLLHTLNIISLILDMCKGDYVINCRQNLTSAHAHWQHAKHSTQIQDCKTGPMHFYAFWMKCLSFYYVPNFKQIDGAYWFRVVRASIRSSKTVHARVLKFHIWIPHGKIFDARFFFLSELSPFLELCPFE